MKEEEKEKIINEINEKNNRLEEINKELTDIWKRKELIKTVESALKAINYLKGILKGIAPTSIVLIILTLVATINFPLLIVLYLIGGAGIIFFLLRKDIKKAIQAKKTIKENEKEYESAKLREEKDKELELTLTDERVEINREILFLNISLAHLNQDEELENSLNQIAELVLDDTQNQIEEQQELERPEIDTTSSLRVTFPPLN